MKFVSLYEWSSAEDAVVWFFNLLFERKLNSLGMVVDNTCFLGG